MVLVDIPATRKNQDEGEKNKKLIFTLPHIHHLQNFMSVKVIKFYYSK